MPRVANKLSPTTEGGWIGRKRIPENVREAYAKAYGAKWEERFNSGPCPFVLARAKHREWLSEIEARIANLRAAQAGHEGLTLTPMQARALAGEWYHWFLAKQSVGNGGSAANIEAASDALFNRLSFMIRDATGDHSTANLFEVWEGHPESRAAVRSWVSDKAETAQFLFAKKLVPDTASRDLFLDYVTIDLVQALDVLAARTGRLQP
jgi:hypothetical protein